MLRQLACWLTAIGTTAALASCAYLSPPVTFDPNVGRQPVACTQILEGKLLQFPFGQLGLEETALWIQETYGIAPEKVLATTGASYLRWKEGSRTFSTAVYPAEQTKAISVEQADNPPIVEEVLKCFGEPSYVYAYYDPTPDGPMYTVLQLWYTGMGVEFGSYVPAQLDVVDPQMPISGVSYSRPGPLSEMILARYEAEPESDEFHRILGRVKPWPGDLDGIVIDDAPYVP